MGKDLNEKDNFPNYDKIITFWKEMTIFLAKPVLSTFLSFIFDSYNTQQFKYSFLLVIPVISVVTIKWQQPDQAANTKQ